MEQTRQRFIIRDRIEHHGEIFCPTFTVPTMNFEEPTPDDQVESALEQEDPQG